MPLMSCHSHVCRLLLSWRREYIFLFVCLDVGRRWRVQEGILSCLLLYLSIFKNVYKDTTLIWKDDHDEEILTLSFLLQFECKFKIHLSQLLHLRWELRRCVGRCKYIRELHCYDNDAVQKQIFIIRTSTLLYHIFYLQSKHESYWMHNINRKTY